MADPEKKEDAAPGDEKPAASPELDALEAEARTVDNGGEEPQPEGGPQPGAEQAKQGDHYISTPRLVQGVLLGSGNLLGMRYPAVKRVYTPERCMMVGEAVAPVLDRWGINATSSVAMQYLVAIGALAMLGMDTVEAIRASTHSAGSPPPGAPAPKPVP